MHRFFLSVSSLLLIAGCSTNPAPTPVKPPGAAMIRIEKPGFGSATGGELLLNISKIDGRGVGRESPWFVAPGKRELDVSIGTIYVFRKYGSAFVEFEFEADHVYRLVPGRKDGDFTIDFIDESDPSKPNTIKTAKVKSVPGLTPLPIPIPVK
jgi:hypothetical protein